MKRSRNRRAGRVMAALMAVLMAFSGFGGVWAAEGPTGGELGAGENGGGTGLLGNTIEEGGSYRADLSSVLGGGYEEAAFTYAGDVQGYTYGDKEQAAAGEGTEGTRTLLVSENVYTGMSWQELNEQGLIYGDYSQPLALEIDGVVYDAVIRSLSGGSSAEYRAQDGLEQGETEAHKHGLPEGNEWDSVVDKSVAADEGNGTKNLKGWIKNWDSLATFTQDLHKSGDVTVRGMAARGWNRCAEDYTMATYGFRPVLEIVGLSEAAEGIPLESADGVESGETGEEEPGVSGSEEEYVPSSSGGTGDDLTKYGYKDGDILYYVHIYETTSASPMGGSINIGNSDTDGLNDVTSLSKTPKTSGYQSQITFKLHDAKKGIISLSKVQLYTRTGASMPLQKYYYTPTLILMSDVLPAVSIPICDSSGNSTEATANVKLAISGEIGDENSPLINIDSSLASHNLFEGIYFDVANSDGSLRINSKGIYVCDSNGDNGKDFKVRFKNEVKSVEIGDYGLSFGREPKNIVTLSTTIGKIKKVGSYAFKNAKGLDQYFINSLLGDGDIEYGEHAFDSCGLTEIPLKIQEGMEKGTFTDVPLGMFSNNKITGTVTMKEGTIGDYAFANNPGITGVSLEEGVTRVSGFNDTSVAEVELPSTTKIIGAGAFSGTKLSKIDIPEGVEEIGSGAFYNTQISSLDLLHTNLKKFGGYKESMSGVTDKGVVQGTGITEDIQLPDSVEVIGHYAFRDSSVVCNMPKALREIGVGAFMGSTAVLGDEGVLTLPANVEQLGPSVFQACSGLKEIVIPDRVTLLPNTCFYNTSNLTSVTLPEGLKAVENYGFYRCTALKDVELPEGLESIGYQAFYGCKNLGEIWLPSSFVKYNGYNTGATENSAAPFYGCTSATAIYVHANTFANGINTRTGGMIREGQLVGNDPNPAALKTYYNVSLDLSGGTTADGEKPATQKVVYDWNTAMPNPTAEELTQWANLAETQPDGREFGGWKMTQADNFDRTYKVLWKEPLTGRVSIEESGGVLSADVSGVRPYDAWEGIDNPYNYFFSFEWYKNGEKIKDGEIADYKLYPGDMGSEITVKLIGKEDGPYAGSELISDPYTVTTTVGQPYMRQPRLDKGQAVLRWIAPEGGAQLTGYRVYVSTTDPTARSKYISGFAGKLLPPETTRIQLDGAAVGTTYYARVEAVNVLTTTSSDVVTFTVKDEVDAETPEVRVRSTDLQADCDKDYELSLEQLEWEDGGRMSYRWYYKQDTGEKGAPFQEVIKGTTKDITIPAEQLSQVGSRFYYYCEVTNTNEGSGISGLTSSAIRTPEISVTVVRGNPDAPVVTVEKLVGGLQVSWDEVKAHGEPVTAYKLYVSRQADMDTSALVKGYAPKVIPADRAEDGGFSYTIDYMDTDQTYWIQVEAVTDRVGLGSVSEIVSSSPAVGDPVTFLLDQPDSQLGSVRLTSVNGTALDPQDVTKNMYVKLTAEPAAGYQFVEWRQKPLEDPENPEPLESGDLISGSFEQGDVTARKTENPMILLIESDCRWEAAFAPITVIEGDGPRLNGMLVKTPADRPLICEDGSLGFSEEKLHYTVVFTSQEEPGLELELMQFNPNIQVFVGDSVTPVAIDYSEGSENTAVLSPAAFGIEMADGAEIPIRLKQGESETIYKVTVDILEEAEDPAVVVELETRTGAKHADLALKVENLQFSALNVAFRLPEHGIVITDTGYTPITGSGLEANKANYYGLFKGVELQTLSITEDDWGTLVRVSLRSADNKMIVADQTGAALIKFYANQDEALAEKTVDEILAEAIEIGKDDGGDAAAGDLRFSTGESGLTLSAHPGLLQKRKAEMHDINFVVNTMTKVIPGVRWTAEDLNRDDDKQLRTAPEGEVLKGKAVRFSGVASNYRFTVSAKGYLKGIVTAPDVRAFTTLPQLTLLAGDLNGDGIINLTDLTLLIQALNQTVEPGASLNVEDTVIYPDFNWDGTVDALDEAALLSNYEKRNK